MLRAGGYGSTWRSLQYNLHFLVVWFSRVSNRKKITNCVHDFFLLTFAIAPHPVDWLGSRVWSVVVYWKWSYTDSPFCNAPGLFECTWPCAVFYQFSCPCQLIRHKFLTSLDWPLILWLIQLVSSTTLSSTI